MKKQIILKTLGEWFVEDFYLMYMFFLCAFFLFFSCFFIAALSSDIILNALGILGVI